MCGRGSDSKSSSSSTRKPCSPTSASTLRGIPGQTGSTMRSWPTLAALVGLLTASGTAAQSADESPLLSAANSSLLWGTYRPGLYFGLKPRIPDSLLTGLVWFGAHDWQSYARQSLLPPPDPHFGRLLTSYTRTQTRGMNAISETACSTATWSTTDGAQQRRSSGTRSTMSS